MPIRYDPKSDSYSINGDVCGFFTAEIMLDGNHSLKETRKLLDTLHDGGLKRACIRSRPNKKTLKVLEHLKSKGVKTTYACETYLGKDFIAKLKPIVDNIRFSIYGCEGVHDYLIGRRGSFRKVWDSVVTAKKHRIPVYVSSTLTPKNITEVECLLHFCLSHGIKLLSFFRSGIRDEKLPDKVFDSEVEKAVKMADGFRKKLTIRAGTKIPGRRIIIHNDGKMFASPVKNRQGLKFIGNVLEMDIAHLWKQYPYRNNYVSNYTGKA